MRKFENMSNWQLARHLVRLVQGTMSLEGQGICEEAIQRLVVKTKRKLDHLKRTQTGKFKKDVA